MIDIHEDLELSQLLKTTIMSVTIQYGGTTTGLDFEIPLEFIENRRNSQSAHQICEFYLQGNNECVYGNGCKKLHVDPDYFQNNIAQKIIKYMKENIEGDDNKTTLKRINNREDNEEYSENEKELDTKNDVKICDKIKENHRRDNVSFSIRMDIGSRHAGKQRNDNIFHNIKNSRYHPFFLNPLRNINKVTEKRLFGKHSFHQCESDKKVCIYERGEPCENNEVLMEVKYGALLPTKGREIAMDDQDGTYRLQICKFFQRDRNCLDGRNCFFAHLNL